jgi:hypothetical protein
MCASSGVLQALAGPLLVCRSHCAPWLGTVIRALLRALTASTTTTVGTATAIRINVLQSADGTSLRGLLEQLLLPNSTSASTTASDKHTKTSAAAVAELMSTAGLTTTTSTTTSSTTGGRGDEFDLEAVSGLLALQLAAPSEQLSALVAAVTAACPDAAALASRAFLQQELAAATAAIVAAVAQGIAAVGGSASATVAALVRGDSLHAAAFADHLCSVLAALPGTRNSIHNSLFTSVILPNYAVSMQQ